MNRKGLLVLMALMSIVVLFGKAQSNLGFYHTNDLFNSSDFNPAFLTFQKNFTISVFPLAGASVGYNDRVVIEGMLSKVLVGKQTNDNLKEVFISLVERDLVYQRMENSLLYLGYNTKIGSFNFWIKEVEQFSTELKGNLSDYLLNKSPLDFQSVVPGQSQPFPAQAIHYREYSLGYAKEIIKNKLSIGLRAKIYFGKSSVSSEVQGKILQDNGNYYLETYGELKLSAPVDVYHSNDRLDSIQLHDNFSLSNYLMNPKNLGAGFDLGINYKIAPDLVFSASVIDVGRIYWKSNVNSMNFIGKPILFDPSDPSMLSSAVSETLAISADDSNFSTRLPATFYAGLKYQLFPNVSLGAVDRYIKFKDLNHNSFSIMAGYTLNKNLTISSGYSIIGNSRNIPLGVIVNWRSGQFYIGSDNVLSYIPQAGSEFSGLTAGVCIFLFRKKTKTLKQLEYLPFYQPKDTKQIAN
ncbi:MAG: DUF5723 family protein [Bacteroidota bacterium]|nr:DUF5723 family protein [Bacteroidota bacterium]